MNSTPSPTVTDRLDRLPPGTRLRLFHLDGGGRIATSGTLLSVGRTDLRMTDDEGRERTVALGAVTCFYVPSRPASGASFAARALAGLRRFLPARERRRTRSLCRRVEQV